MYEDTQEFYEGEDYNVFEEREVYRDGQADLAEFDALCDEQSEEDWADEQSDRSFDEQRDLDWEQEDNFYEEY